MAVEVEGMLLKNGGVAAATVIRKVENVVNVDPTKIRRERVGDTMARALEEVVARSALRIP